MARIGYGENVFQPEMGCERYRRLHSSCPGVGVLSVNRLVTRVTFPKLDSAGGSISMSAVGVMRKQTIGSLCCFGVADFSTTWIQFALYSGNGIPHFPDAAASGMPASVWALVSMASRAARGNSLPLSTTA